MTFIKEILSKWSLPFIIILLLVRIAFVVVNALFFSEMSFVHSTVDGILFERIIGPKGWPVTILLALFVVLLIYTIKSPKKAVIDKAKSKSKLSQLAPIIGLLFLSPWVGEYLLGNVSAASFFCPPDTHSSLWWWCIID